MTVSRNDTLCVGFVEFRSITLLAGNSLATPLSMVVGRTGQRKAEVNRVAVEKEDHGLSPWRRSLENEPGLRD